MNIAEGDCEWVVPHPPHIWGETLSFLDGGSTLKVWACSGTVDGE